MSFLFIKKIFFFFIFFTYDISEYLFLKKKKIKIYLENKLINKLIYVFFYI
jgi:hypothetical protein